MGRRKAGRPSRPLVSREQVMKAALDLLEEGGLDAVTMRALAKRLGVNPMAAYHYFNNKDAVLAAAAAQRYRRVRPRLHQADAQARLLALGLAYARRLRGSRQLLGYLLSANAPALAGPVDHFDRLFSVAVGPTSLPPGVWQTARNAFADLVHGFALAGPAAPLELLKDELHLLIRGMRLDLQPRGKADEGGPPLEVVRGKRTPRG